MDLQKRASNQAELGSPLSKWKWRIGLNKQQSQSNGRNYKLPLKEIMC